MLYALIVGSVCNPCNPEPYVRGIYNSADECLSDAKHLIDIANFYSHLRIKCEKPGIQPMLIK